MKLLYATSARPLARTPAPEGVLVYPSIGAGFKKFRAAPSTEWIGPKADDLETGPNYADLQEEAAGYTFPTFAGVQHYVGGYPIELQSIWMPVNAELSARETDSPWTVTEYPRSVAPELEEASQDWRLLLQIDSDERLGWDWFGGGRLYVLVRRQDASRRDFSHVVTICQFT